MNTLYIAVHSVTKTQLEHSSPAIFSKWLTLFTAKVQKKQNC